MSTTLVAAVPAKTKTLGYGAESAKSPLATVFFCATRTAATGRAA